MLHQENESETPRFQKLELQVERFRIQLERIVSDIESEKRTRADANSEIRNTIERMADKFNAAIKELSDNYKDALKELSNEFRQSHRELTLANQQGEQKTQAHLAQQDKFQYKLAGAFVGAQVLLAFLAPWLYKYVFRIS